MTGKLSSVKYSGAVLCGSLHDDSDPKLNAVSHVKPRQLVSHAMVQATVILAGIHDKTCSCIKNPSWVWNEKYEMKKQMQSFYSLCSYRLNSCDLQHVARIP